MLARCAAFVAVAFLLAAAPAAARSTLERTLLPAGKGFRGLAVGPGERHAVRSGGFGSARAGRAARRRAVVHFAQLTDPQLADELSPARVDFLDPLGGELRSAHRPQEALGPHVLDRTVRAVNRARRGLVRDRHGRRTPMAFALTTGDLADNQQLNETRWFRTLLDGGRVDPFSGRPVGPGNPCPGTDRTTLARLDADVAARRYTGVQDFTDFPGQRPERYAGFYDPDRASPVPGPYAAFPRHPGLLDRAQRPFRAAGLAVPWLVGRGNHDGLVQGTAAASNDLVRAIAVGCLKVLPDDDIDPAAFAGADEAEALARLEDPQTLRRLLANAGRTAPDPDRRIVSKRQYKRLLGDRHGFGAVARAEERASAGTASYYAVTRRGVRFVALDTVAEGGGASGNLDDPQFRWLARELERAERAGRLVVVFGHHTLGTLDNTRADEAAGACDTPDEPGCDADPRASAPLHLGLAGPEPVRDLLLAHPNVIAYVAGHTHRNDLEPFAAPGGRSGFWQVNTASHTDPPQQARTLELFDNRDGTLSLFTTVLDHDAPVRPPAPGTPARGMSDAQLASLARVLAFNDPQRVETSGAETARGEREDRNAELVLRDPR